MYYVEKMPFAKVGMHDVAIQEKLDAEVCFVF